MYRFKRFGIFCAFAFVGLFSSCDMEEYMVADESSSLKRQDSSFVAVHDKEGKELFEKEEESNITPCSDLSSDSSYKWVYEITTLNGPYSHYRDTLWISFENGVYSAFMPMQGSWERANKYPDLTLGDMRLSGEGLNYGNTAFEAWFDCIEDGIVETYRYGYSAEGPYLWTQVGLFSESAEMKPPSKSEHPVIIIDNGYVNQDDVEEDEEEDVEATSDEEEQPVQEDPVDETTELEGSLLEILQNTETYSKWTFVVDSTVSGSYLSYRDTLTISYENGNYSAFMPMRGEAAYANTYPELEFAEGVLSGNGINYNEVVFSTWLTVNEGVDGAFLNETYLYSSKGYEEGGCHWILVSAE